MRATDRTASAALVGALLLLAACSGDGDDEPVTLPPTAASTASVEPTTPPTTNTPSSEPTPTTQIVLPDAHVESVEALILNFFEGLSEAQSSGDFTALDATYLPQCGQCEQMRAEIVSRMRNGQNVAGGRWVIVDTTSDALADNSQGGFSALAYRTSVTVSASDGSTIASEPQTGMLLFNAVVVATDNWSISDLGYRDA